MQNESYAQVDDHHFDQFNQIAVSKGDTPGGTEDMRNDEHSCKTVCHWRAKKPHGNKKARSKDRAECPGEESNLHAHYGHMNLNHARLPIPPPGLLGKISKRKPSGN